MILERWILLFCYKFKNGVKKRRDEIEKNFAPSGKQA